MLFKLQPYFHFSFFFFLGLGIYLSKKLLSFLPSYLSLVFFYKIFFTCVIQYHSHRCQRLEIYCDGPIYGQNKHRVLELPLFNTHIIRSCVSQKFC